MRDGWDFGTGLPVHIAAGLLLSFQQFFCEQPAVEKEEINVRKGETYPRRIVGRVNTTTTFTTKIRQTFARHKKTERGLDEP